MHAVAFVNRMIQTPNYITEEEKTHFYDQIRTAPPTICREVVSFIKVVIKDRAYEASAKLEALKVSRSLGAESLLWDE